MTQTGPLMQDARNSDRLFVELLNLLYIQAPSSYLGSLAVASFTCLAIWSKDIASMIIYWYVAVVLSTAGRLACVWLYHRKPTLFASKKSWYKLFICMVIIATLQWVAVVFLFIPTASSSELIFLSCIIAGVAAGGITYFSGSRLACIIYTSPPLLALSVWCFNQDASMKYLGILLILFLAILLISNKYTYKVVVNSIQLQFRNEELNQDLVTAARKAGMAEVATNVLHNVGNVLNSVVVSSAIINESIDKAAINDIGKIGQIIQQNQGNLAQFFGENPKGKQLAEYIVELSQAWKNDKELMIKEAERLNGRIGHIKNIIAMQQSISGSSLFIEKVNLEEEIRNTVSIANIDEQKSNIKIIYELSQVPPVQIDKSKLVHILLNIIINAKDALNESKQAEKTLIIILHPMIDNRVTIEIADNGIGIDQANINKIFDHEFTTKKTGHGYGLHGSANAAKEMNGRLQVVSEGRDKGAKFILTFVAKIV